VSHDNAGGVGDDASRRSLPAIGLPERLRTLVDSDRCSPVQQPRVKVDHERWASRLGHHADIVGALPVILDRETVRAFVTRSLERPGGDIAAFIATQVWGYWSTGYGPYRVSEALSYSRLSEALRAARKCLRDGEPVDAFRSLCVENRIPWTGTAFGTKYLYFADPHRRSLILDSVVGAWLARHAGLRLRLDRDARAYATWLAVAEQWAHELDIEAERLELIIFTDGLQSDSLWKRSSGRVVRPSESIGGSRTCAGAITHVLELFHRPMRAAEIADQINESGLYQRRDGQPLPAYQVSSIARANAQRFSIDAGLITLAVEAPSGGTAPKADPGTGAASPICVLIGCVSRKAPTARAAKDLYRSELFSRRRAHAEARGLPWLIVSARYGCVDPDAVIDPYDVRLTDLNRGERKALAELIADQLERRFGALDSATFEVHAGTEYMDVLTAGPGRRGAHLINPLQGLRIGEQLHWYGPSLKGPPAPRTDSPPQASSDDKRVPLRRPGLAQRITAAFQAGALDLGQQRNAPTAGWAGMPEVQVAQRMRLRGASDEEIRGVLTFTAAMDRARDADALWFAAERLFEATPWTFDPAQVVARSMTELSDVLRGARVSQRHTADAAAWRLIAETLNDPTASPVVRRVVFEGHGDARELLEALQARSRGGTDRFPFLRGPKVGPMWVRMMAHPGAAQITTLDVLPVAVDVQVRKITEYLAVTDTGNLDLDSARPIIQAAWADDVAEHGAEGPGQLAGTAAALDPALWFWAKWGCTQCERNSRQIPVAPACEPCRFPLRA
jgi:hypothetical protein